jgi:hypothetical protein
MYYTIFAIRRQLLLVVRRYTSMRYFLFTVALLSTMACAQLPVHAATDQLTRPRVPRIKLLRSNPHRLTAIRVHGTDPYDAPDDDYICSGAARRPKVARPAGTVDDEVSDYVAVRLAVARARAMQRYRQVRA